MEKTRLLIEWFGVSLAYFNCLTLLSRCKEGSIDAEADEAMPDNISN